MRANDAAERPRRFYKAAGVAEVEGGGFAVVLDGRTPKTPLGAKLILPTRALARLIADEWEAQAEFIVLPMMGATRLAYTVIDHVGGAHAETAAEVARYAGSDMICYFADAPDTLVQRQIAHWGPVIEWAQTALDLHLVRAQGIVHQPQPPETLARAQAMATALDDFSLAGLAFGASLFGSAVLAFALQMGQLSGEAAFDLSRLDQAFQEERWGIDDEAAARTAWMHGEALLLERWFEALQG
jgi:chaperone required for assembly of F1-ATPase